VWETKVDSVGVASETSHRKSLDVVYRLEPWAYTRAMVIYLSQDHRFAQWLKMRPSKNQANH
jgi:hypothetical protein